MISVNVEQLPKLSKDRLQEARLLFKNNKLHGAKYLGGYAIEHAIKYRICKHLSWSTYPPPNPKAGTSDADLWRNMERSLKTHDLEILLVFSGELDSIFSDASLAAAWDNVKDWKSELRYERTSVKEKEKKKTKNLIDSVAVLMRYFKCPTS